MSSSVSDSNLERKFQSVTNTQDSIQSLSLWIIHHKNHAQKIVDVWMRVLKKAKISQRLTLFYLANDVIQNSKRKGTSLFLETFQGALTEVAILLKDEQIRGSVQRVLKIWEQRAVYTSDFIDELNGVLNNTKTLSAAVTKIIAEFKPEITIEKIRQAVKVEGETTKKFQALTNTKFDAANTEILRQFKDRKHGQQFSKDFEDATRCLEEYIIAVEQDLAARTELIQILEQAEIYYDTQRGEARIVSNAYKSFSTRVLAQKKRLEEITKNLPSPFPSPCADAPSPTNSEEMPDFSAVVPKAASPAESVPSPEGTPEDLRLSPPIGDPTQSISQTVSSFMPQAGMMAFWLEAFQSGSPSAPTQDHKNSSSLDSRLMNLMHKIPNKPPFLEQQKGIFSLGGDETPVKDEHSGQGTPVQDEGSNVPKSGVKTAPIMSHHSNREAVDSKSKRDSSQSIKPLKSIPINKTATNQTPDKNIDNNSKRKKGSENGISNAQEEMAVSKKTFIEPLKPPPMPNFESFGFLDSPPTLVNAASKSRIDPRLNSQNYKSNRQENEQSDSFQGDDTEIMDMELEDSDDGGENTSEFKKHRDVKNSSEKANQNISAKSGSVISQHLTQATNSAKATSLSTKQANSTSSDQLTKTLNMSQNMSYKDKNVKDFPLLSRPIENDSASPLLKTPTEALLPIVNRDIGLSFESGNIDEILNVNSKNGAIISDNCLIKELPNLNPNKTSDIDNRVRTDIHVNPKDPNTHSPSTMPSFSQHRSNDHSSNDFLGEGLANHFKVPSRGFSRIETIQTLRSEEWASDPSWDMEMPLPEEPVQVYDFESQPMYSPRTSMPYHRSSQDSGDYDYRYNGSNFASPYDNGMRNYQVPPPEKRFPQRPPFRRGRRGYFNKRY